jgi:hypothetical protein
MTLLAGTDHVSDGDGVNISRSVKQDCNLSPLSYVLCLEPFIRKVCSDSEIKGMVPIFIVKFLLLQMTDQNKKNIPSGI